MRGVKTIRPQDRCVWSVRRDGQGRPAHPAWVSAATASAGTSCSRRLMASLEHVQYPSRVVDKGAVSACLAVVIPVGVAPSNADFVREGVGEGFFSCVLAVGSRGGTPPRRPSAELRTARDHSAGPTQRRIVNNLMSVKFTHAGAVIGKLLNKVTPAGRGLAFR